MRFRARIAIISLHTSPLDQPGAGDSGGMNVEIRAVADGLSARGIAVDVFTRCSGKGVPEVERLAPLARVIQVQSGPCAPVPKGELASLAEGFGEAVIAAAGDGYDLVHAHYWLSVPAARIVASHSGAPLVASFHTLAEVKNRALSPGEAPESLGRIAGERQAVRAADLMTIPTPAEASHLVELYGADPERLRVVPPGVDHDVFFPQDRATARARLSLGEGPVVLFLGRFEPIKGPDIAIRAFAEASRRGLDDATLVLVGGPSGAEGSRVDEALRDLAASEGISEAVTFVGARPHRELPWIYSAGDVLMMPSRSEAFGLAALEAQACGVPVVAADVGGLP
ncbi:MAG: glycosyltransferase, partial [Actinomycetota bacterium]|nr:glycosyltransferase [Actinomycetota bacterium]